METLSFLDILKVFSNPINEEQAWAVCFQCANFLLSNHNQELFQQLLDHGIRCVCLNKHGEVLLRNPPDDKDESENVKTKERLNPRRSSSFNQASSDRSRYQVIATERDAIQALGMAVFEALDYGIDPSEERQLSHDLESLISSLTSAKNSLEYDPEASNADDEGIEKDADVECQCTLEDVLKKCSQHLSTKQNAHHHYKAVCRALFTEAGELMTFLDKISTGKEKLLETQNENSRKLEELQRADWACLWSQVMKSLRQGVLLKKVEHVNLPPVEYELTPFEMLLEDIRSRRYTLHKIMVDGNIPSKVKNDAHAVILDFIRSRPPLKKVNERQLKPRVSTTLDLHESLLKEIRSRPKLRPTRDGKLVVETSRSRLSSDNETEPPLPVKKILKPDFSLFLNNSFEESSGDENHSPEHSLTSPVSDVSFVSGTITPPSPTWFKVENTFWQDNNSQRLSRLQRRHTIMVCESPVDGKVAGQALPPLEEVEEPPLMKESHHLNCRSLMKPLQQLGTPTTYYSLKDNSRNVVLRSLSSQQIRSLLENQQSLTNLTTQLFAIQELEDDPLKPNSSMKQTKRWQNPIECLSLTLEEVTHIRSVLSKAELESLQFQPDLYHQISKGKICFTCKTTKFTLFGEWGTKCKFCYRTVCSKCLRKMNVPTDHFRNVPVYTLCPSSLTPEMEEVVQNFIKTAPSPSVPQTRRASPSRDKTLGDHTTDQQSLKLPYSSILMTSQPGHFGQQTSLIRSQSVHIPVEKHGTKAHETTAQSSIKGLMMAICCDCKGMVTEIVRVSRTTLNVSSSSASVQASSLRHS